MLFKKHFLVSLSLTLGLGLSLVGCGGSEAPTGVDSSLQSSLGGLDSGGGLTPLDDGGITPLDGTGTTTDAYDPVYNLPADGAQTAPTTPVADPTTTTPAPTDSSTVADPSLSDTAPTDTSADLSADIGTDASADLGTDLGTDLSTDPGSDLGDVPGDLDVLPPFNPGGDSGEASYSMEDSFNTDQDTFNQWQAVNLVSDGANLYIAAVDQKTPTKGTVIQMDTSGGSWADIGKSFLSTITLGAGGYDMEKTIQALALDNGGNLLVVDHDDRVYKMPTPDFDIQEVAVSLTGASDATFANGNYFVTTSFGIEKVDTSLGMPTAFSKIKPSGGLGTDSDGNLYVVDGMTIQKIKSSGQAQKVVSGLEAPVDVAVNNEGDIFVLTNTAVQWYDASGKSKGEFGQGDFIAPRAICTDAGGSVYVADFGTDHKDSKIVKYSKSSGGSSLGDSTDSGSSLDSDLSDLTPL